MDTVNIRTPKKIYENSISNRINIINNNTIEYKKSGYGVLITNKPLNSVRLELALDDSGLTQEELAKLADVKQPTISRIIQGKIKLSKDIPKIAKTLGISSEWLSGQEIDPEYVKMTNNILRISNDNFILIHRYMKKNDFQTENNKEDARDMTIMIPANSIDPSINSNHLNFIRVTENANLPDIHLGSSVTFNMNDKKIINGCFFVINYGVLDICVRELHIEPNGDIRIKARQVNFPEYIIKHNDESFKILGRVIAVTNIY